MKMLVIQMPDGSKWGVPVAVIARDRATHYAHEFGGDVDRSMNEDTMLLFDEDAYEVQDWAANNMDWKDVAAHAQKLQDATAPDFQEAWRNGDKSVIDVVDLTESAPKDDAGKWLDVLKTLDALETENAALRAQLREKQNATV